MNHATDNQPAPMSRRDELVVQEMPDEILVYDLRQHKAHCLNQTAAFVWNHCDGQMTAAEIAELMEKEWRKPIGEDVVWLALKQLGKANLLQEPLVRPEGERRFSRRAAMRKLGVAAAATLPFVATVIAPTAASAASVPPACQACTINLNDLGATCPPVCTSSVIGGCYANNSCMGTGNFIGCMSCSACNANADAKSWRAPDVC